jgi:AraC-like DNA-binding protein
MYSYIYLSLIILGLFLIVENLKGGQKLSLLKLHFVIVLSTTTIISTIDFANNIGYNLQFYETILRVINTVLIVNVFQIVANNKLPKSFIILELSIISLFFVGIFYGYRFAYFQEGYFHYKVVTFSILNIFVINPLIMLFMGLNLFKIIKRTDLNNLYQRKIRTWAILLFMLFILILLSTIVTFALYLSQITLNKFDSRIIFISYRFILFLFIFLRPKFLDDIGVSYMKISPFVKGQISVQNFELLFYHNHYFLRPDSNLEDFALNLNHTKTEVVDFIKHQSNNSFIELVNKNRITYFKNLLKTKQHDSFTIEALSEMSGFNNRQSMYNSFKKYEGCSPSEYINNI